MLVKAKSKSKYVSPCVMSAIPVQVSTPGVNNNIERQDLGNRLSE